MSMLSLFVTTWPVQVQQQRAKKHMRTEKLRLIFVKPCGSSDGSTLLVFCKPRQRKTPKDCVDSGPLVATFTSDPTLDFPFLRDPLTRRVIEKSKVLFLMRGLSGSGKSTVVRAIADTYPCSVVCSADDYFLTDGGYSFDASLLSSAHSACQTNAKTACNDGVPVVIVDNTNVRRWEMKFYLELASYRDYVVVLVQPKTPWRWNPVELAARNKHGVEAETLRRKVGQFDDEIPVYYGWFLNTEASRQLSFICHTLLRECVQHFSQFPDRLLRQLNVSPSNVDWQTLWGILQEYYTHTNKAGSLLHCTAKFCGGGRAVGAKSYHAHQSVQNSCGQAFTLAITSVCFSPRSAGARVQLSDDQLQLFDKPEEKDWDGIQPGSSTAGPSGAAQRSPKQMSGSSGLNGRSGSRKKNSSKASSQNQTFSSGNGIDVAKEADFSPARTKPLATLRGRSAHITLGSAYGFGARETNFDVLRLCDMEAGRPAVAGDFMPVTGGMARYFGDGVCCVYFYQPLLVHTIFSGFY